MADMIASILSSPEDSGKEREGLNIVDALFAIADGLQSVARSIRDLGNADAATPMGAIEAFGAVVKDDLCSAISMGLSEIASSIDGAGGSE